LIRRSRSRSAILVLFVFATLAALHASSPKFFQAATQNDFLKGDVENLSIDSRGQLLLGPAMELIYETASPFIWALVPGSDGSLFVGTGNDGRVFKVDGQGKGASFFDATELEAHALAPAPDGGLYVATSPDGKIYKLDRSGKPATFFEPGERYIWSLATDAKGFLYAATGEKGIVYRIAPDGKGAPFYQAKATHITALAFDRGGNLLVGTESPGRVIRVDPGGKGFVLLDSPFQEIRALRFDDKGILFAAAVSGGSASAAPPRSDDRPVDRPSEPSSTPVATVTTEVTSIAVVDVSGGGDTSSATTSRDDRRAPRGAIYRITPDGLWDEVWESRDDSPYDVAFDSEGRLMIATGNRGKLFRLEGNPPQPTLVSSASAQQITAFHRDSRGQLYFATANPGKVFRVGLQRAARGTYESEPRDAQVVSSWGTISWRGSIPSGSGVEISTRSGNTPTPDDTWSEWSPAYNDRNGSPIASPKARYLQWRAVLNGKSDTPILTSITAAYLQRNLRPEVRSITVHPPGIVFQKPFSTGDPDLAGFENQTTPDRKLTNAAMSPQGGSSPTLGRRTYQKGLQTLVWRADDENDDELSYEVRYRREGETAWRVLRDDLREEILVWDTTTVPNGTYFVKIVASDSPSNATDTAMAGEMDSAAFEVDNTPPQITAPSVRKDGQRLSVAFEVTDDHSPILRVECSYDGQEWRAVFPTDGIADSRVERYDVALEQAIGPRGLTIRVTDSMNNVMTRTVN
jgi:sugar lactone lactonase YvrE